MAWIIQLVLFLLFHAPEYNCEQLLLSNMSWSDTVNKDHRLKIVTVATENEDDGYLRFMRSAKVFNLDVEVFGLRGEWLKEDVVDERGGHLKLGLLRQALEKYKNDKKLILMFTDSYQTIFTAGKKEILKKFFGSNAKILISAEDYCWNDRSLKTRYLVRSGDGYRYLCSGGIIGYAPAVYMVLSLMTIKPSDDYQLYYRHIFLDDRKKYHIKWDRRATVFQNLNGFEENTELKFTGSNVRIINTGYKSEPIIIHGNGPSNLYLNQLANYAPKGWTLRDGCIACDEDLVYIQDIPKEEWPTVLIGLFVDVITPFVDSFLMRIYELDYPKDKIDIFIHNKVPLHKNDVEEWITKYKGDYKSLYHEGPESSLTDQQARNIGIYHCRKVKCDYYFSVDADVTLINEKTLVKLIEQNRSFLAPMVSLYGDKYKPNFWGDLTNGVDYGHSFDYYSIANSSRRGVWNVPYVSSIYLIKSSVIKRIGITPFHSEKYRSYIQFCAHLRKKGVFMYITNMEYFGYLKNMETYSKHHKHNDLYQLFDNIIDWEDKYLHQNFTIEINRNQVEQPCHDVFSIPVFSTDFTKHLREEIENTGKWYMDGRIKGGYENIPTSGLKNIGFERHWLDIIRQYFIPMAEILFPGYLPKPISTLNIVVQNWAGHKPVPLISDMSTFTINVALNEKGVHYKGGGERYVRYDCSVLNTKEGWATIYPGRLTHQYESIKPTKGIRYTLVSYVDP